MKKEITYNDLVAMNPCYKPDEIGITKGFKMPVVEFIKEYRDKVKSKDDIIWVICRNDYMTDRDLRLFAVWCAREALKLVDNPDERSINACDVAEKYANGEATDDELASARDAAWAAAWDASRDAAWAASRDAAWAASRVSARDAAWDAQIDKLITYFK